MSIFMLDLLGGKESIKTGCLQNIPRHLCLFNRTIRLLQCDQNQIFANGHHTDEVKVKDEIISYDHVTVGGKHS